MANYWRTGIRLAWRDLRKTSGRAALTTLSMALSVATISGVRGAADVARQALQADSRAWLAADLAVDTRDAITRQQVEALDAMKPSGIDWTLISIALTMAASSQAPDPGVIAVKAIDPRVYPFYGKLTLRPPQALSAATIAVSPDVLERMQVQVGGVIRIARHPFRIAALIESEPDRFTGELGLGMRGILSEQAFLETGLEDSGNAVKHRILLRLKRDSDLAVARRRLQAIFPGGNIRDYRAARTQQTAMIETGLSSLGISAFLALALGVIGIAISLRQHAVAALPSLAILRMLGARSPQLAGVLFLQTGWMMLAALALGLPLGFGVRTFILSLGARYLTLPQAGGWNFGVILESLAAALLALTPVLVGPALMVRNLRPAVVLRQGTGEPAQLSGSLRDRMLPWIAGAASYAGIAVLAFRMLGSWRSALVVIAALGWSVGLASILTSVLLVLLRRWAGPFLTRRAPLIRHGLAGLYRPGNRSRILIVVMAAAFTVMITSFETSAAAIQATFQIVKYDPNNLYIGNFKESNRDSVRNFLKALPGVNRVTMRTQARLELRTVLSPDHNQFGPDVNRLVRLPASAVPSSPPLQDGTCVEGFALDTAAGADRCVAIAQAAVSGPTGTDIRSQLLRAAGDTRTRNSDEWNYFYSQVTGIPQTAPLFPSAKRTQPMTVDYYLEQRANLGLDGRSYTVICREQPSSPGLTIADDLAGNLGASIGSKLIFAARDRTIAATVVEIRKMTPAETFWSRLEMDCGGLEPSSLYHLAAVRSDPDHAASVRTRIRERYPSLAILTPDDISETVTAVSRDAVALIRLVAWFAVAAGLCVLISVVASSRSARLHEIGIFSALGAGRAAMLKIYTVEFAAMGLLSGAIASLLACGFTSLLLTTVFQSPQVVLPWQTIGPAITGATLLSVAAGWLPTYRLLQCRPLQVLRGE